MTEISNKVLRKNWNWSGLTQLSAAGSAQEQSLVIRKLFPAKEIMSCGDGRRRDGFACVVTPSFLLPVELHEGDVQMPLEKLWQGAEHGSGHPEAHPGRPPRVRQAAPPLQGCGSSQHSPTQAPGLRASDAHHTASGSSWFLRVSHQVTRPRASLNHRVLPHCEP